MKPENKDGIFDYASLERIAQAIASGDTEQAEKLKAAHREAYRRYAQY